jgi:predicted transcriptional regulator
VRSRNNKRNRKKKKRGRPIKVEKEESYLGVVIVAAIIRLQEVLG